MSHTIYRTYVESKLHYSGESLEEAVRTWDRETYSLGKSVPGGVAVAEYEGHPGESGLLQLRDGWVLHVHEDGTCYLNPRLVTA